MKPDKEVHFTIIGLGKLMEVIWHCFTDSMGGDDLAKRALATTADSDDLQRKQQFFNIPVQLGDNLEALKANRPDIIFFAPPPSVAPEEIATTLKDYFSWLRGQRLALPEIYAFPPVPPGSSYLEVLGDDVLVSNIIPNNVNKVAGKAVVDEGYYACSFTGNWPEQSKSRLGRIFASQGAMVEVPPEQLVPMLGGTCSFFCLWHVVPVISDILKSHGLQYSHNQIGEYMRGRCQKISGFVPAQSDPACLTVSEPVCSYLDSISRAWWNGISHYYADISFPAASSKTILERGFDIILHTTQCESREALYDYAVGAATKGGVLEKAIATFDSLIKPLLESGAPQLAKTEPADREKELTTRVTELAHRVGQHGQKLAS
jgi:pyrroline-5-carboxylate reductase